MLKKSGFFIYKKFQMCLVSSSKKGKSKEISNKTILNVLIQMKLHIFLKYILDFKIILLKQNNFRKHQ